MVPSGLAVPRGGGKREVGLGGEGRSLETCLERRRLVSVLSAIPASWRNAAEAPLLQAPTTVGLHAVDPVNPEMNPLKPETETNLSYTVLVSD